MNVAVYTDVVAEELGAFLADYDVGELLAYKAVAGALRRARPGAGAAAPRRARFQAQPRQRALGQWVAAALRELPPTCERSAARLRVFPRCRAFTSRKRMAVKIVTRHNSRRSLSR